MSDPNLMEGLRGELAARLWSALDGTEDTDRLLLALASVDPGAAIAWILEVAGDGPAPSPRAVQRAVDEALAQSGALSSTEWLEVLRRHGDRLSKGTAGRALATIADAPVAQLSAAVAGALQREPADPFLLRSAFDLAVVAGDVGRAHEYLDRIGRCDPSQGTMGWIYLARREAGDLDLAAVRIAILSSFTADPLVHFVDFEIRQLGLDPDIYLAPFNSWAQEILREDSGLYAFDPEIVFLSVSIDDLVQGLDGVIDEESLVRAGRDAVGRIEGVAGRFRDRCDAHLVVHGFHTAHRDPAGPAAGRGLPSRAAWLAGVNERLTEALCAVPRTYVLDTLDLLLRRPNGSVDNAKVRHLAGMRLVGESLAEVAHAYAGYVAPLKGLTRKCVVLDLDNTLWGGVVGEDGVDGIRLGPTAPGSEYHEFQRYLATLTERGILLAVCSKNNPDDALEAIRTHEWMVLREDAFSALRINWDPKPQNLVEIAAELDIGVDSLVFIDDNPHERELMRQALPQVLTPELPADPSRFREAIERLPQLQSLTVTDVDRMRVSQYQALREREALRSVTESLDTYLGSLGIEVEIAQAHEATLPRTLQLFQRTNQFNLTTRRYSAGDLERFSVSPDWKLYTAHARDRFGDHGLVATALVETHLDVWRIDSFLMSCRVISYGIETALLHAICLDATSAGAGRVVGELIESPKNAPARDFYSRHGFVATDGSDSAKRWELELAEGHVERPAWIELEVTR